MQKYTVIRHHEGDKTYKPGDTREAEQNDVAHLIGRCLEPFVADDPVAGQTPKKRKAEADRLAAEEEAARKAAEGGEA